MIAIAWDEKDLPALVVEKASNDYPTLEHLLSANLKLSYVEKAEILAGVTSGLELIHVSNMSLILSPR